MSGSNPTLAKQRQWNLVLDLLLEWSGWERSTFFFPTRETKNSSWWPSWPYQEKGVWNGANMDEGGPQRWGERPSPHVSDFLIKHCLDFSDAGLLKPVWFDFLSFSLKLVARTNCVVSGLWFSCLVAHTAPPWEPEKLLAYKRPGLVEAAS